MYYDTNMDCLFCVNTAILLQLTRKPSNFQKSLLWKWASKEHSKIISIKMLIRFLHEFHIICSLKSATNKLVSKKCLCLIQGKKKVWHASYFQAMSGIQYVKDFHHISESICYKIVQNSYTYRHLERASSSYIRLGPKPLEHWISAAQVSSSEMLPY